MVLDHAHPLLAGKTGDDIIDAYVFAGNANLVRDVMVSGNWAVRDGRHENEKNIARDYSRAMSRLTE